ncbi:MAG: undecaprenyl-diphosphate phosphatase [Deltaproteobacteria bacterium]|nr:undecaprenyl-diphosphate phosphatase [Deltaproteobacteria bacterium]
MDITHAALLALIQGVTEFLPISSTAHLILVPLITGWPDQGLSFDVALNTATWLAVLIYFRSDVAGLIRGFLRTLTPPIPPFSKGGIKGGLRSNPEGRLAWMVLAATVPVGIAGVLAHDMVAHKLRSLQVIGWSSILWGIVLWFADRRPGKTEVSGIGWQAAMVAGLMQAIALIPGTSRSGITMTAGLFMGLSRTASARFSFLLAIVVGALAGAKEGIDMFKAGWDTPWLAISVGFVIAFVTAYLAIHYFLKLISRSSMAPFVVYRIILGAVLLWYAFSLS